MPGRRKAGSRWLSFRGEIFGLDSAGDYQPLFWPAHSLRPAVLLGSHPMHARPIAELIRFKPRKHLRHKDFGSLFSGRASV